MASRVLHFGVTTKTNRTRKVAVGTVKKSMAAVCENCKLVAKREDLRMQGSTRSKSGGNQSEKGNKKRAHRGSHHNLTTDRNVFSDRTEFSVTTAYFENFSVPFSRNILQFFD